MSNLLVTEEQTQQLHDEFMSYVQRCPMRKHLFLWLDAHPDAIVHVCGPKIFKVRIPNKMLNEIRISDEIYWSYAWSSVIGGDPPISYSQMTTCGRYQA